MDQADEGAAVEKVTRTYAPGDAVAVRVGFMRFADEDFDRAGVFLEFPAGAPNLPFSVVWDGTPLRITLADEQVTAPTPAQPEQKLETNPVSTEGT